MEPSPDVLRMHAALVAKVSDQVKAFHAAGTPFRIYHGSTNTTRPTHHQKNAIVNLSGLKNVLKIDTANRIVSVEPNVAMDELAKATIPYGYIPPVVPEFPGITAGGGFAGTAGESSSFKYGFLDATVESVEAVLGDGTVRELSRHGSDEEKELFFALAGTLGTIGVVTRLDIRLVETKGFVELSYYRVNSFDQAMESIKTAIPEGSGVDFVDCIMYSKTKGAVIKGRYVEESKERKPVTFTKRRDQWYYLHVQEKIDMHPPAPVTDEKASSTSSLSTPSAVDYVPLTDYLFRYDRGGFWVGRFAFHFFGLPFTHTLRTILDTCFKTRFMFHALHASNSHNNYMIQDVAVPFERVTDLCNEMDSEFGIYPLWLCPLKFQPMGLRIKHFPADTDLLLNIGIWGGNMKIHQNYRESNRALERMVRKLDGVKWLYAQMFYTNEEFWDIYDREEYVRLREKYKAQNLPNIYDKIKQPGPPPPKKGLAKVKQRVIGFWVFPGLYGMYKTFRGGEYVIKKA